ncbi:MAG: helix-turn-helix domain-containing protein [Candidatus Thorarchaeota archaeon]
MIVTIDELRQQRVNAGFSQSDLALEVGVSQSYIARMERGDLDPKYSIVCKIVQVVSGLSSIVCSEIMDSAPKTIDGRQPVAIAKRVMDQSGTNVLIVLRGARVVGCLTYVDIIRNEHLDFEQISAEAILNPLGIPIVDENSPIVAIVPLLKTYRVIAVQKQGRFSGTISRDEILKLKSRGYPLLIDM